MYIAAVIIRWAPRGLLVAALLGSGVAAAAAAPSWVPPAPDSMVTDRAGALTPATRSSLASGLARYEQRSGHQVVVWIDRSSGGVPIEEFAVAAFAAWKVGRKGLDDGLAIFAMTEDRAIRIEVGYALEATVTDMVASSVIRNTMIPLIKAGDWDAAILGGVGAVVDTIEGAPGSLPEGGGGGGEGGPADLAWTIGLGLFGLLFLFLLITNPRRALMLLFLIGRSGMGGGFGGGGGGGGGFRGGGGRSGGGGASGHW
jgi:uncharacterized protein